MKIFFDSDDHPRKRLWHGSECSTAAHASELTTVCADTESDWTPSAGNDCNKLNSNAAFLRQLLKIQVCYFASALFLIPCLNYYRSEAGCTVHRSVSVSKSQSDWQCYSIIWSTACGSIRLGYNSSDGIRQHARSTTTARCDCTNSANFSKQ